MVYFILSIMLFNKILDLLLHPSSHFLSVSHSLIFGSSKLAFKAASEIIVAPGSSTAPVTSSARPVTTVTSSARPVTTRNNKPKAATRVGTHTAASPTAADEYNFFLLFRQQYHEEPTERTPEVVVHQLLESSHTRVCAMSVCKAPSIRLRVLCAARCWCLLILTARQQQLAAHDTRIAAVCGASDPPTDPREGRQTTRAPTADERLVFSPVVVVQ
ncbi:hypothetical protein GWK47_019049 [Chionoecetes opilio]|uniref:Uncharacterized protein n=1 Tax=Chionoecetes opilio TaxID=41210 RepID=A0A8J4XQQ7_CHIOP|nr:hypothetical protein GWK47_019049 [Chionoecetes opilio]